LSWL